MGKYRVVVTDYVFPNLDIEREELKAVDADLFECESKAEDDIIRMASDADALLTCYAKISLKIITALNKCRIISRYGIGVDNIDIPAATEKGIPVTSVPDYCVEEVSDHALALLLNCSRKVCQLNSVVKRGGWDFKGHRPLRRLHGQTLGLVGFGKIPRLLAQKVIAYGFRILAYDPYSEKIPEEYNVELVDLNYLLRESDIVSLHAPLTEETRGIISYEKLKLMKREAFLINTARADLINEQDLVKALKEGQIAGAGLDLISDNMHISENELLNFENVTITPHVSFYSEQSLVELQTRAVKEVVRVLKGEKPEACVNPKVLKK